MKKTSTVVQTTTNTLVGVSLIAGAVVAAAAGFITMATNLAAVLNISTGTGTTAHSAVQGAVNEPLLSFNLEAKNKDIAVKSLTFNLIADSDNSFATIENDLPAANLVTSCKLVGQASGNVFAGPVSVTNGNILTFGDPFTLPANTSTGLTLKCDLANNVSPSQYILAAELTGYPGYVVAQAVYPIPDSRINVGNTADVGINVDGHISVTVRAKGSLSASLSPATPASDIALAGATTVNVSSFNFAASNEAFTVQKLTLKNPGDDAAIKAVKIKYLDQTGADIVMMAPMRNHLATFSGLNFYIPAGAAYPVRLDVAVDTNPIPSPTPTVSGMALGMNLDFSSAINFQATGASSGTVVDASSMGNSISAYPFVLRKTRPTFVLSSASPSGAAAPGYDEVLAFNAMAAPGGNVGLKQLMFKITTTNNGGTNWNSCSNSTGLARGDEWGLKNMSTGTWLTDIGDWTFLDKNGQVCTPSSTLPVAYAVLNFGADPTTGSPTITNQSSNANNFALFISTGRASATADDSISAQLITQAEASQTNHAAILWTDADTGVTNIDGTYIRSLPVTGYALTF